MEIDLDWAIGKTEVVSYRCGSRCRTDRTTELTSHIEVFEGVSTSLYQRRRRRNVFLLEPRKTDLPEADTARYGQQSVGDRFHPFDRVKFQRPNGHGWDQGLGDGRQSKGTIASADRRIVSPHG